MSAQQTALTWHETVDFLSVGSGGAGMTGALTAKLEGLSALVIEKSEKFGGTTSLSGGVIWIPNNHLMDSTPIQDSEQDAKAYLDTVVPKDAPRDKLHAYVKHAPEMLKYLSERSHVQYDPAKEYPDYYPSVEGAKLGARSLDPKPFSAYKLGTKLTRQLRIADWFERESFAMTAAEAHIIFSFDSRGPRIIFKNLFRYWLDLPSRLRKLPDSKLTLGRALVGRLRKSLIDNQVPLWHNTELAELVLEDGKVIGVKCLRDGQAINIRVNKAVLMASGGFAQISFLNSAGTSGPHFP